MTDTKIISNEEQKAIHAVWLQKSKEVIPHRAAFEKAKAQDPRALRTFEHEKLESSIQFLSNKLAPAWQADIEEEIKDVPTDLVAS